MAINQRLINKNDRNDTGAFSEGWMDFEVTIKELAGAIAKGFAFCAQMKGGTRKAANFKQCGFLAVDIDDGLPLEQIETVDIVKSSATMIYTTASHTEDAHRYRIVFALAEPILDRAEYAAALRSLVLRTSGDIASTDPARIFYGNDQAGMEFADRGLSREQVRELIDQSFNAPKDNRQNDKTNKATTRSLLKIAREQSVVSTSGDQVSLADLGRSTPIYCPFHNDRNPSAFVVVSQSGTKGIHCSSCDATFWPEDLPEYNFYAFDEQAVRLADLLQINLEVDWDPSSLPAPCNVKPGRINIVDERYVESATVETGVTLIKSPKGSGKTEFLKRLINENNSSVLLIGHRRTLIGQMCARLGLDCYLDKHASEKTINESRYGISLDSIQSIPLKRSYDFVLIDECEQVLSHILSDTLAKKRSRIFRHLQHIIKKAKHVVALDADLGAISFNYLSHWARMEKVDTPIALYINQRKTTDKLATIYHDQKALIGDLDRTLQDNRRVYVTSNHKGLIDKICAKLKQDHAKKKFLVVTSETTNQEHVQRFLADASGQSAKYDAILASPSISSGIDISFPDELQLFDVVYGIFESGITNHFECDQQLSRVRQPKEVKVFLSPRLQSNDTNRNTVMIDVVQSEIMEHLLTGFGEFNQPLFNKDDDLLDFVTSITAQNRASINNLKANFIDHKRRQGWEIVYADIDEQLIGRGSVLLSEGKKLNNEQYAQGLLSARTLDDTEFNALDKRQRMGRSLTNEQFCDLQRTHIERFYCTGLTRELITLDNRGRYRSAVLAYDLLINNQFADLWATQERDSSFGDLDYSSNSYKNRHSQDRLIRESLQLVSLFKDGTIDSTKILDEQDMGDFVNFLVINKDRYAVAFAEDLRNDLRKKPFSQLGVILAKIGLKQNRKKSSKRGKTIYRYSVDQKSLDRIDTIVNARFLNNYT